MLTSNTQMQIKYHQKSSGLIHHAQKMYLQTLQRSFCPLFRSISRASKNEKTFLQEQCEGQLIIICDQSSIAIIRSYQSRKSNLKECNCRKKDECPLNGECKQSSVVYKCEVSAPNHPDKVYISLTEKDFKVR